MENQTALQPTQILALFQTSKEDRASMANQIMDALMAGEVDPLTIHLQLKCTEDLLKEVQGREYYKELVLTAAQGYGQKSFTYQSAKVEIKEVGTKYDWSTCGDARLTELLAQQKELESAIKQRQDFLKMAPAEGVIITDPDSGETYMVYPPTKSSTTSIAVTLK